MNSKGTQSAFLLLLGWREKADYALCLFIILFYYFAHIVIPGTLPKDLLAVQLKSKLEPIS